MNRFDYYEKLKGLARELRREYGFNTPRVSKSDLRKIYKKLGIRIDLWPHKTKKLRGAYFNDEHGCSVMIVKGLPEEPTVFTMAHEIKHHLCDQDRLIAACNEKNESDPIEIGAEIFAAELIYPDEDFFEYLASHGITKGQCTPEDLVRLKQATQTTLSYMALAKRTTLYGYAASDFSKVKWKKLEESMFGEPVYKRVQRYRRAKLGVSF
jgi:Zn-dependent peptidase ImmA (M78 family)